MLNSATVKFLSAPKGFILLHTEDDDAHLVQVSYESDRERNEALATLAEGLNQDGMALVFEHRQQVGESVQTIRFYVEVQ